MNSFQTIMVTGGAGFIGAHFIHYLFDHYPDLKIINFDKLSYAANLANLRKFNDSPNYIFIEGDICDADLVEKVLTTYQIDTIVHFAAESHVDRSIEDGSIFVKTNVVGTNTLLQAFLNAKHPTYRFHHVSTDEVYGSLNYDEPPFTELYPYKPSSPYSASKASSDLLVKAYYHTYNLPCTISNCSNNYGLFQHEEKLIPKVIQCCLNQSPIPLYGEGKNIRDWIHVNDHCAAIDRILQDGQIGEQYNVGGEHELSNISLIEEICSVFDELSPISHPYRQFIKHVPDRLGHDFRYAIDNNKIHKQLNWRPLVNFNQALKALIKIKMANYEQNPLHKTVYS